MVDKPKVEQGLPTQFGVPRGLLDILVYMGSFTVRSLAQWLNTVVVVVTELDQCLISGVWVIC